MPYRYRITMSTDDYERVRKYVRNAIFRAMAVKGLIPPTQPGQGDSALGERLEDAARTVVDDVISEFRLSRRKRRK